MKIKDYKLDDIRKVKFSLASPEMMLDWSHGEVKKPETINYKSHKAEPEGLFCQKIFGPVKDYECACGKYKKQKYRGIVCERCGVEVIESKVRRHRLGHIELAVPIAHIWYVSVRPIISRVLSIKQKSLKEVIYFASHIVIKTGETYGLLKARQTLDHNNAGQIFLDIIERLMQEKFEIDSKEYNRAKNYVELLSANGNAFNFDSIAKFIERHTGAKFGIGAQAIYELLQDVDLDEEIAITQKMLETTKVKKGLGLNEKFMQISKRLDTLESFKNNSSKPEWTILKILPVIPPEIRPLISLDGGKFTSADVNEIYRKIIIRNERVKKFLSQPYTDKIILRNEMRMLQDAVDTIIDNARRKKPTLGKDKRRIVKSLTESLKGKQGRFRQNLLGKRVDFSGRSVIAVGPELKMNECGLPAEMVLKLFEPFIARELVSDGIAQNAKVAQNLIADKDDMIWASVEKVIKNRTVLLNRAPTLHRLSVQSFYPKIVNGKAIRLHPLVTPAFNADFDGDQMAVHVPISPEALYESKTLLLGSKNILGLKDGKPIVTPSQDMVLGNYYLTKVKKGAKGEGSIFVKPSEALRAYETGAVSLHAIIALPVNSLKHKNIDEKHYGKYLITTVGKAIFNDCLPDGYFWINEGTSANASGNKDYFFVEGGQDIKKFIANISEENVVDNDFANFFKPLCKNHLGQIIYKVFTTIDEDPLKPEKTSAMLDNLKDIGFRYATKAGITVSVADITVAKAKEKLFKEADALVKKYNDYHTEGLLTQPEKHKLVVGVWNEVKDKVQKELKETLESDTENPIFMMSDSGARGNISNFTQLAGMRGLMATPRGDTIEIPVKSSFREGLKVSEFFISTHGARKGLADTALNTGASGYFTRRLVDVGQDVIVQEEDCGTKEGQIVSDIVNTKDNAVIIPLKDRIIGRTSNTKIEANGTVIVERNELITEEMADAIVAADIKEVEIRSVFTCETKNGICQKCFGTDLSTNRLIEKYEAAGVIAAQSIGEPGTQLTMRTFHTGGVAGSGDITQGLPAVIDIVNAPKDDSNQKKWAVIAPFNGKVVDIVQDKKEQYIITVESVKGKQQELIAEPAAELRVSVGDEIEVGQKITEAKIKLIDLLAVAGRKKVANYMLKELHKIYKTAASITVSDKYFEIIIRQLLSFDFITDPGETDLPIGIEVPTARFEEANEKAKAEGKKPAKSLPRIIGSRYAPLKGQSFLAAASFTETIRMIVDATIKEKEDKLIGIKENVLLGKRIPVGTGKRDIKELVTQDRNDTMGLEDLLISPLEQTSEPEDSLEEWGGK